MEEETEGGLDSPSLLLENNRVKGGRGGSEQLSGLCSIPSTSDSCRSRQLNPSAANISSNAGSCSSCSSTRRNSRMTEGTFPVRATSSGGSAHQGEFDEYGWPPDADASYFMRLFHRKNGLLKAEISRLERETETATRETQQLSALQRRKEELESAVRCLQKDVAIMNLAVSQGRLKLTREDVIGKARTLRETNEEKRKQLDQLFLSNRMRAEQLTHLEAEQEALWDFIQAHLRTSQPQTREQHQQLQHRLREQHQTLRAPTRAPSTPATTGQKLLQHRIHEAESQDPIDSSDYSFADYDTFKALHRLRVECATTFQELASAEARLRGDGPRQKMRLLRRQEAQLRQLQQLDATAPLSSRPALSEQRAALQQIVQDLKDEICQLESKQQRAQLQTQKHQARLVEIQDALAPSREVATAEIEEQENLRLLTGRDTEISAYIEQHTRSVGPALQRRDTACTEDLREAQQQKHKLALTLQQVPTREQLQKLEEENARTREAIEHSESSAERLKLLLSDAEAQLSDVQALEEIKQREIWEVERRTQKLREEIQGTYEGLEALRRSKADEKAQLHADQQTLKQEIVQARANYDSVCRDVSCVEEDFKRQPDLVPLQALLGRLVEQKAVVSQLVKSINLERGINDYETIRDRCLRLTQDINVAVRRALASQATATAQNNITSAI